MLAVAATSTMRKQRANSRNISTAFENAIVLGQTLRLTVDAETGQRGYLLTNDAIYLQSYNAAHLQLPEQLTALDAARIAGPRSRLALLIAAKLARHWPVLTKCHSATRLINPLTWHPFFVRRCRPTITGKAR